MQPVLANLSKQFKKVSFGSVKALRIVSTGNKKGKFISHMAQKLETEEIIVPKAIPASTAQAIMQARQAKGWTQAQLAKAISEKLTVVEDYEGGKAVAENRVLAAMEKALGCKLARAPKAKKAKVAKGYIADEDW